MTETQQRLITGFSIGALAGFSFLIDYFFFSYRIFLYLFITALSLFLLHEFYQLHLKTNKLRPHVKIGSLGAFLIPSFIYMHQLKLDHLQGHTLNDSLLKLVNFFEPNFDWIIFIILLVFYLSCIQDIFKKSTEGAFHVASVTSIGVLYTSIGPCYILLVVGLQDGFFYTWFYLLGTIGTDVAAYFAGKYLGKHKIKLTVSPNKTYEGYVGGVLGCLIILYLFYYLSGLYFDTPDMGFVFLTLAGFVISIMTILGDLTESLLKRDLKVKDSNFGVGLPGHGGFLDTFDSLIFTTPAFYYFHKFFTKLFA